MKKIFVIVLFLHQTLCAQAPNTNKLSSDPIPLGGVVVLKDLPNDESATLKNVVIHEPLVVQRKEEIQKLKQQSENQVSNYTSQKTAVDEPTVIATYPGNSVGSGTPLDNHIAVSNGGKILAVQNSNIGVYNSSGTSLQQKTLGSLAQPLGVSGSKYDPRVIYDPLNDRFIIVFLNGSSASSSRVIVGFSATNDPAGAWYMYSLMGNLKDNQVIVDDVWTDFPSIGISTTDLYITGNLFTNGGDGKGAGIWQIPLSEGYNGAFLNPQIFVTNYFSLFPVTGATAPYGPHMYFIRSNIGSSNNIHVHYITDSADNNGVLNNPVTLSSTMNYVLPPDAVQKGTSTLKLSTNDTRIQSAYLENDIIAYTLNTSVGGRPSVHLGSIYLNNLGLGFSFADAVYITSSSYSLAYPNVVYAGCGDASGNNSLVFMDYCGPNNYPGIAVVAVDALGNYSDIKIAYEGGGYIGFGSSSPYRWGDYSGAALRLNGSNEIWAYGVVGSTAHVNVGRLGKFTTNLCALTSIETNESIQEESVTVYPNPVYEEFTIQFEADRTKEVEVYLCDVQGRIIKLLVSDKVYQGIAKFSMNVANLSSGTYFVKIMENQKVIATKKIIKNE